MRFLQLVGWFVAIFVAIKILRQGMHRLLYSRECDGQRRFTMAEYRQIMNRAGWRCEHFNFAFGRCQAKDQLEADHIQPWSRGGATTLANSQALCHKHNVRKKAWVPSMLFAVRLERHRRSYFPDYADVKVRRRQ